MGMLQQPHIAVIDPCLKHPELETFNRMAAECRQVPLSYHMPAMFGLSSLEEHDVNVVGIIILGSAASVTQQAVWQDQLSAWLKKHITQGTPIFGICYGHQLLATLLGGKVGYVFPDHTKTKGWRPLQIAASRLWPREQSGELVVSHAEMISEMPPSCRILSASTHVPCEAFEHETLPIWGLQAHPEATPDFMRNQNIDGTRPWPAFSFGHRLVDAFLQFVHTRVSASSRP